MTTIAQLAGIVGVLSGSILGFILGVISSERLFEWWIRRNHCSKCGLPK
jgi:hypothetical protein